MPHFSDDIYLGSATGPQVGSAAPGAAASYFTGVGPLGRVFVYDITPAALSTTAICAAQAISGSNVAALINGASASGGVATLDVPRALQMASANAGDTTQTVTVTGTDFYGRTQTETRTLNGTTAVNFLKAFRTVTGVRVSATMAGNLTVGSRDAFGLPYRVTDAVYVLHAGWDNTLARNAGTLTVADTAAATATTGDPRGLYAQTGNAANGTRRLVLALALPGIAAGPNATETGAIGVTPA